MINRISGANITYWGETHMVQRTGETLELYWTRNTTSGLPPLKVLGLNQAKELKELLDAAVEDWQSGIKQ